MATSTQEKTSNSGRTIVPDSTNPAPQAVIKIPCPSGENTLFAISLLITALLPSLDFTHVDGSLVVVRTQGGYLVVLDFQGTATGTALALGVAIVGDEIHITLAAQSATDDAVCVWYYEVHQPYAATFNIQNPP